MNSLNLLISQAGGVACLLGAASLAVRAHLLGSRVSGWPSGPRSLRWGLWTAAAVLGGQGLAILRWGAPVDRGECLVYAGLALYALVAAVNLVRQRGAEHAPKPAREPLKLVPARKRP